MPFIPPFEEVMPPPAPDTALGAGLVVGGEAIGPVFESEAPPAGLVLFGVVLMGFVVGCGTPPEPDPDPDPGGGDTDE